MPKLIAHYHDQSLGSLEETVLELYHANLSIHQVMSLADQLWGTHASLSEIIKLHRDIIGEIDAWRERPIAKVYPYVFLAGVTLKCNTRIEIKQASILAAVGVNEDGFREVLGVAEEGERILETDWGEFLQGLNRRGLSGVRLFIGDRREGLAKPAALIFPGASFQSSLVQFGHDLLSRVPIQYLLQIEVMLEWVNGSKNWSEARGRIDKMASELKRLKLTAAAEYFDALVWDTMNYLAFPLEHRRILHSNAVLMRLLRSVSERTRMVGAFSDGASAVHLVSARLRHIESTAWSKKRGVRGRLHRSVRRRFDLLVRLGQVQ